MKSMFLIISHILTSEQIAEAREKFNITNFTSLPDQLQTLWSQVPPELPSIKKHIMPIKNWLATNAKSDDIVLVQGDFGATFMIVDYCLDNNLIPIYATTKRNVEETILNENIISKRKFSHVLFRLYERIK